MTFNNFDPQTGEDMSGMYSSDYADFDNMFVDDYDDDGDGDDYLDMYDDDEGNPYGADYETYQGDFGEEPYQYYPTLRARIMLRLWLIKEGFIGLKWNIHQYGGIRPYVKWAIWRKTLTLRHKLRMRFDKAYREAYIWDDIPF